MPGIWGFQHRVVPIRRTNMDKIHDDELKAISTRLAAMTAADRQRALDFLNGKTELRPDMGNIASVIGSSTTPVKPTE